MKKFLAVLLVALLIAPCAFAASSATPTVVTKQCYEDSQGVSYCRVIGTLAFDSTYGCATALNRCGASLDNTLLGLSSIKKIYISPANASNVGSGGGEIIFGYKATDTAGNGRTGAIRAYVSSTAIGGGASVAPLVSAASYDFSALTAVPFEAVGPVL
jgi:hypothetical protein